MVYSERHPQAESPTHPLPPYTFPMLAAPSLNFHPLALEWLFIESLLCANYCTCIVSFNPCLTVPYRFYCLPTLPFTPQ